MLLVCRVFCCAGACVSAVAANVCAGVDVFEDRPFVADPDPGPGPVFALGPVLFPFVPLAPVLEVAERLGVVRAAGAGGLLASTDSRVFTSTSSRFVPLGGMDPLLLSVVAVAL